MVALAEAGALLDITGVLVLLALPGAGAGGLGPAGAQVPELADGKARAEDRAVGMGKGPKRTLELVNYCCGFKIRPQSVAQSRSTVSQK